MQISTFTHQHPHTYTVVYFYEPSSIGCENHQRTWLQDTALVFGLEDAKFTSDEVKEKVKIAQETEAKINTISQNYCILFASWLELGTFHCQKSVPIMLQSAFHIFPARVDSYRPKNDIEVFRELWACARFLSTSFANNLLYWFGSWTSHAKTLLRQFPMPLRPLPKLPGPVASRGSLLFFLMMELSKMHTFYKQPGTCFTEANCFFTICLLANHFFTICLGCDRMMIIFVFVTFRVFQLTNVLLLLFEHFESFCCQCWFTWNGSLSIIL